MASNKHNKLAKIAFLASRNQNATVIALTNRVTSLETTVQELQSAFNAHTHNYVDTTIADTSEGTSTPTNTNKTTSGVN